MISVSVGGNGTDLVRPVLGVDRTSPGHLGDGAGDREPAPIEVDVTHPERGELAEAESAERQDRDGGPVVTGRFDHREHLGLGEEPGLGTARARQFHPQRGVAGDPVVVDGGVQEQRQHTVALPNGSG